MSSHNVDFLLRGNEPGKHYSDNSDLTSPLPSLDRSTGSPDSLRSETSSDSPVSIMDALKSLQHKAAIVTDTKTDLEKPEHSYIALISMAILSSHKNRMVLGEIYEFIMKRFPYYNNQQRAWRNSIRHNLSINECFIKNGRADNGKGNYWSIHPACVEDFSKGDFRRRQARRRARKSVKNVNRNQFTATEYHCNARYMPMTPSSLGYQSMTLSPVEYQPMTSYSRDFQPMTPPPFSFQPMTSPLIGSTPMASPLGYQRMRSQASSPSQYEPPSHVGSKLSVSSIDLNQKPFRGLTTTVKMSSEQGQLSMSAIY
ncbi:forkhead box protein D1-like [Liolophura sinensis]|uniref:forkhead box protein D1-like n=1 Tax=Liolophura sinensis TaxID=3198878 RepID=UPI003158C8E6